jgi:hypothetical protein
VASMQQPPETVSGPGRLLTHKTRVQIPSRDSSNQVYRIASFLVAIIILCLPAIWNGFPLLFDDVGGYLERWPTRTLGLGRSAVYGLLIWVTASTWWIAAIALQAAVTTWVIDRALKVLKFGLSPWPLLIVVVAIAATTRMTFLVSEVMPDAWAAPAVLALHLLVWHPDRLNRFERAAMAAIIAFAGASHMAILGLLVGLSILHTVAWFVYRPLRMALEDIVIADAAAWFGIVLLLAVDLIVAGRFALTPGGDVILFGRLVGSGQVSKILAQECPQNHWRLCAFQDDMREMYSENFMYDDDSPLVQIGGWDDPSAKQEIASIIVHSALAHPFEHLTSAIALAAEQLVTVGASDSIDPLKTPHTRWMIELHAPWLLSSYEFARQQQVKFFENRHNPFRRPGYRNLDRWSAWIVSPVSIASTFLLLPTALCLWRRGHRREAMLPAMLLLALVGNAFICGAISGPYNRYQARLAWLAPLAVGLALQLRGARGGIGSLI